MDSKPPEPIKTDLFRFVTIRTPQLIPVDKKKIGFIYHPNPSKSFFLKDVNTDNIDEARKIVRQNVDSFKAIMTYEEILVAVPEMYAFSSWLTRYRNSLIVKEVAEKINQVDVLAEAKLLRLWDNLFYQALKRKNPTVRQACIQLIVANHFVSIARDPDSKNFAENVIQTPRDPFPPPLEKKFEIFLRRLANAKVVIPKAFSVKRRSIEADPLKKPQFELTPGTIGLKNQHLLSKATYRIDNYNKIKRELRFGVNSLKTPEKDLAALASATGEISNFLSFETKSFLRANPTKGITLKMAEDLIADKVKEENRKTVRGLNEDQTRRQKNLAATKAIKPYSFVLSVERFENDTELLMTIFTGYPGAFLLSCEYEVTFVGSHPTQATSALEIPANKKQSIALHLFPHQTINTKGQDVFDFKGTFTFNNDITVSIDVQGSTTSPTHGQGIPDDTNLPEEIPQMEEGRLFGVSRVGIGIFRRVEQEVCCYVPGEVSRIENILAREYKERTTRSLISTETIEEDITEIEVENQSDTVSTNRNELQTEVANVLTRDSSIGTGASLGVQAKIPGGSTVTADGYFDFASSNSSSVSDTEAQTFAQEVTNSALERVLQKTTQKRTNRILSEFEETNRHGFDNRKGDEHVTGVYRWIDIIYINRVINYGKRLMFEFLIPEPARFYKAALEKKAKAESKGNTSDNQAEEPKPLSDHGINSPLDINAENYLEMGRLYGVTLEDPITPMEDTITKSFLPSSDPDGDAEPNAKECSYQYQVNFLEFGDYTKYAAYEVFSAFNFDYHLKTGAGATETGTYFILKIHNHTTRYDKDNLADSDGTSESKSRNKSATETEALPDVKNSLAVTVDIKNVYNFSINLTVKLRLDEQEEINWQNRVYDALMKAYDAMVEAYETEQDEIEAEAKAEAEKEEPTSSNPDFNRTVEQRELQRIAIEMLTKPFGINMGQDFYFSGKCKVPQVEQTRRWEVYSSHVKFFEQAFDYSLIAYLFYPYYWADECDWADLLQTKDASDPIFEAFLQSGMARVVIPVRKGFEEAVDYYMETGDIWNGGGLVLDTDDDLYLSIDEELLEVEGFVANEWQTRVPTTLTIVQGRSVFLEDEGLPCCDMLEEAGVDTLLRPSSAMLGTSDSNQSTKEE